MGSVDPRMEAFIQGMVNDWCADWYTTVAINAFRGADYEKFYKFRDVIKGLVALPVANREKFKRRIRVIQFLSRIHDCNKPDLIFEYEGDCSPLESALRLVLSIEQEIFVPWHVAEDTKKSLLEALVATLRKQHRKPEELIQKWDCPKNLQKKRLLELLSKYGIDPAYEQFSYEAFKKSMMEFSENIFTMPQPFLRLIAKEEISSKYLYEAGMGNCQPASRDGEAGPSARLTTPVVM
ncbi:telomeric repeat-binding factor 2-like isoform X2 [Anguilla rostrata]|uniref:telomeric repeat-binding factor 2-like isoform X2 n=1 Tax=Anguilla rostrata TaxID=7938 RepID=UPI0030CE9E4F